MKLLITKHKGLVSISLLVAFFCGIGVFFWQWVGDKPPMIALPEQSTPKEMGMTDTEINETKKWPQRANQQGEYRVRYPTGWSVKTCRGSEETLYLSPNEESQAVCEAEKGSQIYTASYEGDQRTDESAIPVYGKDIQVDQIVRTGVIGKRVAFISNANQFVPNGTVEITYEFFVNGRTYILHYAQEPSQPDYLKMFEQISQTLTFE